ncbi:MAG: hypothetical protein JXR76_08325, partial [Deltaproteobacteria bacterium]|nr:hypothetical protein [Deltaproteobacteria bacterium]
SGGAGWWKSPCPDLVRASVGQPAGATRHTYSGSETLSDHAAITIVDGIHVIDFFPKGRQSFTLI